MELLKYLPKKPNGQPRRPRNQAEFRSLYIADLTRAAEDNGITLSNVPELPIRRPTSRTGRKALRKTFDADCRRLRREAGVPARTGPPIPGSERTGHRRFYTLEQCRKGGLLHGIARRDQAMPRWERIQQLHYQRNSLRAIARQVGLGHAQVGKVVSGRLWRTNRNQVPVEITEGTQEVSPPIVVVNSAWETPRPWSRALALTEVYRSRCLGEGGLYKRLSSRQAAYLKAITKERGTDHAEDVAEATESYVQSLSALDVAVAVRQVNLDSGYRVRA